MLERVGLSGSERSWPYQLSGGMAQRVGLARAFVRKPAVLLLDEPFAALDAFTRLQLGDLLLETCRDRSRTVLLVTHDVDEALRLADRIVLLGGKPASVIAEYARSEEHTSELQSRQYLVCRLLLEKKTQKNSYPYSTKHHSMPWYTSDIIILLI